MKKSNLWKIFIKLDAKGVRETGEMLACSLFNTKKEVTALYEYLKKARISAKWCMAKESVYDDLFPNEKYDAQRLRYTMSHLLKTIKRYLIYRQIDERPTLAQTYLCQSLLEMGAEDVFKKEWKLAYQEVGKQTMKGGDSHFYTFQLHEMYYDYTKKYARQGNMHLQEMSDELTMFYLIQTLRQRCLMISHQNVAEQDYEQAFFDEVLSFLRQSKMKNNRLLEMYYHSYYATIEPNDISHFHRLKQLIDENWENIFPEEMRDIYLLTINFCIKKMNGGEKEFIGELHAIYKSGLEREILLEKGMLSRFTYRNVSTIGLIAQEYEWVFDFLNSYKMALHPKERRITFQYNLATYYFRLSQYEKALEILRDVEFKNDIFYNLDIRRMLLRIYFELGHYDALASLLESFSSYIKRHKDLGYHRNNYLNLIKIVKKIIQSNYKKEEVKNSLLSEIKETKALAEREWLLSIWE